MTLNFVPDYITYISCRQLYDLRQYIPETHIKVGLCPIQLPTFASLLLLQELKELIQLRQTIKFALNFSVHNGIIHAYTFLINYLNKFGAEESKNTRNYEINIKRQFIIIKT
jgi:hypothetical protein